MRKSKILLAIVPLLLAAACAHSAPETGPEPAVWSAALGAETGGDPVSRPIGVSRVVTGRAVAADSAPDRVTLLLVRPYVSRSLIDEWLNTSDERSTLAHPPVLAGRLVFLAGDSDLQVATHDRPVFTLSRPVFSPDGDTALVSIRRNCGAGCGTMQFVRAVRGDGGTWSAVAIADRPGRSQVETANAGTSTAPPRGDVLQDLTDAIFAKFGRHPLQVSRGLWNGAPILVVRMNNPAIAILDSMAQLPESRRLARYARSVTRGRLEVTFVMVGWAAEGGAELQPAMMHTFTVADLDQ
ncbi:MAG: hypothetical protein ACREL2_08065 [Gemmatimonadales bacterium]